MYINLNILKSLSFTLDHFVALQLCKQNTESEVHLEIEKVDSSILNDLYKSGYTTIIKGKSNQTNFEKLRATSKGNKALDNIQTPEIIPEDIVLYDWLENMYKGLDKEIGNRKKVKLYIALFRTNSGIEKNNLATLLDEFTKDEDNMNYSHKLEYVFFKPITSHYSKFDLEESRLWQYYLKKEEFFNTLFKKQ